MTFLTVSPHLKPSYLLMIYFSTMISLLFRVVNSQQDMQNIYRDFTSLEKWERECQISSHLEKCTVIRMHPTKNNVINTTYTLHNRVLQTTDSSKYQGVTLSDEFTWQKHVDITTSKANRTLGFIRRNLGDCSKQVKVTAYTTMVRPTLEYSSPVLDPKPAPLRRKIRASSTEGCQVCPLSIYRQDPRLCDKDCAGFRLGIT